MDDIRAFFGSVDHRPSEDMYSALAAIPATVADMANGVASPKVHVSPLDCGVGKTTALKFTVRNLLAARTVLGGRRNVGMVLCIGRLDGIESMVDAMDLQDDEFAVLVGSGATTSEGVEFASLGLGASRIDEAKVLFTTHAMVETRLQGRDWSAADEFFYQGEPRP